MIYIYCFFLLFVIAQWTSKYYAHQRHRYVYYLCTNLISANCLFVYCLLHLCIRMFTVFLCNINHCNDYAPSWDLDWTKQSYIYIKLISKIKQTSETIFAHYYVKLYHNYRRMCFNNIEVSWGCGNMSVYIV